MRPCSSPVPVVLLQNSRRDLESLSRGLSRVALHSTTSNEAFSGPSCQQCVLHASVCCQRTFQSCCMGEPSSAPCSDRGSEVVRNQPLASRVRVCMDLLRESLAALCMSVVWLLSRPAALNTSCAQYVILSQTPAAGVHAVRAHGFDAGGAGRPSRRRILLWQ